MMSHREVSLRAHLMKTDKKIERHSNQDFMGHNGKAVSFVDTQFWEDVFYHEYEYL